MAERKWAGTTYGNGWMHKWLIRLLRYTPTWLLYGFSALFVIPVCLILNPSRKTSYSFYRKRLGYGPWMAAWMTYINHVRFSEAVIDKFAMYAGKRFKVLSRGMEIIDHLNARPEGYIQLSAHIGNYEIAGYTLSAKNKPFNALVFDGEKASVMENRGKLFSDTLIKMIPLKADMSHLFAIDQALQSGEIVSMPADRINGSPRFLEQDFMGASARFPKGPFTLATMRGLDVLSVHVMKTARSTYTIFVRELPYDKTAGRKDQMAQLSRAYADCLEDMLLDYPEQWFNFYDFWS